MKYSRSLCFFLVIAFMLLTLCACAPISPQTDPAPDAAAPEPENADAPTGDSDTGSAADSAAPAALPPPSASALSPDALVYQGAFRLPPDGDTEEAMLAWGGEALAFCPCPTGGGGSLFIVGHGWHTYISEITIPGPVLSADAAALPAAEFLQTPADIRNGRFGGWMLEIPRVGLEVLGDQLYFCWGEHYEEDENASLGTHGVTPLDLSSPSDSAVLRVDAHAYATNDYMFEIPAHWAASLGHDLACGRFRDGGWSGMGPSLYAISTENFAGTDGPIPSTALIQYDDSYGGDAGSKMMNYSHADAWTGGAWLTLPASEAVVFAGTHGYGDTWYGFSNGVVWPTDGGDDTEYPEVPEWPHDARGWWNDDFRAVLVFYDPQQFTEVAGGNVAPNEVQPYAFLDISEYMIGTHDETAQQHLGGVAYDREGSRVFILELFANEDQPVVHVFTVGGTE